MKPVASLALVLLAAAASAQTVQVARTYKVGDVDAYHIVMKMQGAMAMEMSMDESQKVLAVYDNGEADVETTLTGGKMSMMGMKHGMPAGKPTTMRVTKYGTPVGGTPTIDGKKRSFDFTKYFNRLPDTSMKVGQTVKIDEVDPNDPKVTVKGTTKLDSVTGGIAKYLTVLDVTSEGAEKPMHLDFTSMVEAATGRPTHCEGTITNLEGASGLPKGMPVTSMTLTLDRKA